MSACCHDLSGERAVVIGNGNVAVDVARMLALTSDELAGTDTTDAAIDAFNGAGIREIVMVGRRGPGLCRQALWARGLSFRSMAFGSQENHDLSFRCGL